MEKLLEGFAQFRNSYFVEQQPLFEKLASAQNPHTMIITCADSRVVPELFTSSQPGDIFVCRNVGNIVPPYAQFTGGVSAAIEYAVTVLQVQDIVICGHSDCGAMKATLRPGSTDDMPAVAAWLRHAQIARYIVDSNGEYNEYKDPKHKLEAMIEANVVAQLDHLRTHPSVAAQLNRGKLRLHGWVYDIESGRIKAFSQAECRFVALEPGHADDALNAPQATPTVRLSLAGGISK